MTETNQASEADDQRHRIDVLRHGDRVLLLVMKGEDQKLQLDFSTSEAAAMASYLMGISELGVNDPAAFLETQMIAMLDPAIAIDGSDSGQIVISLKANQLRPIIVQLSPDAAERLHQELGRKLK